MDNRPLRRALAPLTVAVAIVVGLLASAITVDAQAPYGPYETDPILSGGTDGTIWVSEIVGDQVWFGGTFSNVRNHSTLEEPDVASQNLGVIDLNTGLIREDRTFDIDGPVFAIELVDDRIWIGGDFGSVDGETRDNLAVFDAFTGELLPPAPGANSMVHDLQAHDGWLYVAGRFNRLDGTAVQQLARIDVVSGAHDDTWAPAGGGGHIETIAADGDLLVAGRFEGYGDPIVYSIEDPSNRAFLRSSRGLFDVTFTPDGSFVIVAGIDNAVTAFATADITLNGSYHSATWTRTGAMGDIQAVTATDTELFAGFHEGFGNNRSLKLIVLDPTTGTPLDWYVEIDSYWGVYNVQATEQGLVVTGHFENVNGIEARRFAIFRPIDAADDAQPLRPDGDVNCDGIVDVVDALSVTQFAVGDRTPVSACPLADPATEIRVSRTDVNIDGRTSIVDALLIAQCSVGLVNPACAEG